MFFVVFCDVWCSTVPESWLNIKNTTVGWPPKNENPTAAAIKQSKPMKDWQAMNYSRLLGPYKTYDIARAVEIAAVDLSTSDEAAMSQLQNGQTLGTKRERKRPGRFLDQESDRASSSDDDSRDMQNDKETTPKHQFIMILVMTAQRM
ncbi:hypothetical protein KQX54_001580 [Cotesia glomerata]|uniref:Uncharacterized protein n=1 Tax=Cotesia glomerata TaxID=32391 RepID=A0AAV7IBN4_COTGL|nr:hypothetical protein KQX54_001580 [Cotesia glomerata]